MKTSLPRLKPGTVPLRAPRRAAPAGDAAPRGAGWGAFGGAVAGLLLATVAFAPAAWLSRALDNATSGRVLLAETEGSLWNGSALPVLTGGPGSHDAAVLPSRLEWSLRPFWGGLRLSLSQDCCIAPGLSVELRPGWKEWRVAVRPAAEAVGEWPASWLEGLGAPWNTLKPRGQLRIATRQLELVSGSGNWQVAGQADLELLGTSSRLSSLDPLGTYRIRIAGQPGGPVQLNLSTLDGALLLNGNGQFGPRGGLKFRGDARAAPGTEPALNNLLNIIGRRQGAQSVISIG